MRIKFPASTMVPAHTHDKAEISPSFPAPSASACVCKPTRARDKSFPPVRSSELIRNRRARPDAWEAEIIRTKLLAPGWPRGQAFSDSVRIGERDAFRVMVPEYYAASCLSCHGEPKGEMDKTGYPKEGSKVDDLGGVISITLYH